MKLENKQIGMLIAAMFAVGMLVMGGDPQYTYNPDVVIERIQSGDDAIDAPKLARWLTEGNKDFTLLDIRAQEEAQKGKIPKAMNIPLPELFTKETAKQLARSEVVVLYSENSSQAAQAIMLLKMLKKPGEKAPKFLYLEGGFSGWSKPKGESTQTAMPIEQGFSRPTEKKEPGKKIDVKPVARPHDVEQDEGC